MVENTKGEKRRKVPMARKVREILTAQSPRLFQDLTNDQVSHAFCRCARKLGFSGVKLHSFRHTFGTHLIAMRYDITVVKGLLGHEEIKTTLIYAKADDDRVRDAIRGLENLAGNGYRRGG